MDGKQAIIDKILLDAQNKASSIIVNAKKIADSKIGDAKAWVDKYLSTQKEMLEQDKVDIVSRRKINAEIDAKKSILEKKQSLIDSVYIGVVKNLRSLDKKSYLKFVEKMIKDNAEDGDVIVLSNDGILSKEDFNFDINSINISFSKEKGDFVGGVMLIGKYSDKDLSFSSIVDEYKDKTLPKVCEILFGE